MTGIISTICTKVPRTIKCRGKLMTQHLFAAENCWARVTSAKWPNISDGILYLIFSESRKKQYLFIFLLDIYALILLDIRSANLVLRSRAIDEDLKFTISVMELGTSELITVWTPLHPAVSNVQVLIYNRPPSVRAASPVFYWWC